MDKPFSQLLRRARREQRLSQQEVADVLGVRQNTISSWERGIQMPTAGETGNSLANLAELAELLKVEPEALREALLRQTEASESAPPAALDPVTYRERRQAFLERIQHDQADIWVFAADHFPPEQDPQQGETWIHDIRQGATYHVVWLIDLVQAQTLERSARSLWEMAGKIRTAWPERPGIVHYPTTAMFSLEPKPQHYSGEEVRFLERVRENYESYEELASEGIPKNAFKPFQYVNLRLRRKLLAHLATTGPVELLLPRGRRTVPLSGVCLSSARSERNAQPAPLWLFHDTDTTYALVELARSLQQAF